MKQVAIVIYRAIGAGIAIGVMEMLADIAGEPLSRVPFVTSIVLAMALPDAEPAQPRAIVGGHMASSVAGLLVVWWLGTGELSNALAVGLATCAMLAGRMLHPPAGIDAFLIASYGLHWTWAVSPVLVGALLLSAFSYLWRAGEHRLFDAADRAAAPQLWSRERIRALTRRWQARP
ncbi:MAG: HPP family protein [Hyphomicrobiaceae bacterium]